MADSRPAHGFPGTKADRPPGLQIKTGLAVREAASRPHWQILFGILLAGGLLGLGIYLLSPGWTRTGWELSVSLHSPLKANYEVDSAHISLAPVKINLIGDVLIDRVQSEGGIPVEKLATLVDNLRTPVPTITPMPLAAISPTAVAPQAQTPQPTDVSPLPTIAPTLDPARTAAASFTPTRTAPARITARAPLTVTPGSSTVTQTPQSGNQTATPSPTDGWDSWKTATNTPTLWVKTAEPTQDWNPKPSPITATTAPMNTPSPEPPTRTPTSRPSLAPPTQTPTGRPSLAPPTPTRTVAAASPTPVIQTTPPPTATPIPPTATQDDPYPPPFETQPPYPNP